MKKRVKQKTKASVSKDKIKGKLDKSKTYVDNR